MRKPIFVMTLAFSGPPNKEASDYIDKLKNDLSADYHVIMVMDELAEENRYQMFSDHEIEPIKLEELQEIVSMQRVKQLEDEIEKLNDIIESRNEMEGV